MLYNPEGQLCRKEHLEGPCGKKAGAINNSYSMLHFDFIFFQYITLAISTQKPEKKNLFI
jgi:hypothetical protein